MKCVVMTDYIGPTKAAAILDLHITTVRRMITAGRLSVHHRTPGGHARIAVSEIQRVYADMQGLSRGV